jgi:GntR family transcriptional regulator
MKIRIDPHAATPVYKQMIDAIVAAIESDKLGMGDKLPSIRELSAQLGINPNTTAKVYRELEIRGFIESRAGSGCYVKPVDEEAAAAAKTARMHDLFKHMLSEAKARRIEEKDFIHFLRTKATT